MAPILATHEWQPPRTDTHADAPVAVLVHGIAGWWQTWWRVGPAIADRGWRVVAIDQRGHGESPPIDGVATAGSLADDVEATLESLGVLPVDVILAHSLGAAVCMELVHRRPEVTDRLILEDPPGQSRADDHEFQANLQREVLAARADPEGELRRQLAENPIWHEEDVRQDVDGHARCDLAGIMASLRSDMRLRAVELAPAIRVPALYLLADVERSVIGDRRSELIDAMPPEAELAEFVSGHTIHRDRFETYVETVLGWLAR